MIEIGFGKLYKIDKKILNSQLSKFNSELICPHCNINIRKDILKKFICENCKNDVYVKTVNDISYFLTKTQNTEVSNIKKIETFKNKYFNSLVTYGYEEEQLNSDYEKQNINTIDQLKEFIWCAYNKLISQCHDNLQLKSEIYFSMSFYSIREREGENLYELQKKGFDLKLKYAEETSSNLINNLVVISASPDNLVCFQDDKKTLPLQDLIKNPILPHKNTGSKYGCRCFYNFIAERDKMGRIIFNDEEEIQKAIANKNKKS